MDENEFNYRYLRSKGKTNQLPPLSQAILGTGMLMRSLGRLAKYICGFGSVVFLVLALFTATPLWYAPLLLAAALGGAIFQGIGSMIGMKGLQRARSKGDVIAMPRGTFDPEVGYFPDDPGDKKYTAYHAPREMAVSDVRALVELGDCYIVCFPIGFDVNEIAKVLSQLEDCMCYYDLGNDVVAKLESRDAAHATREVSKVGEDPAPMTLVALKSDANRAALELIAGRRLSDDHDVFILPGHPISPTSLLMDAVGTTDPSVFEDTRSQFD